MTSGSGLEQKRVLLVTTWFPTKHAPMSGIFVRRDAEALSNVVDLQVVHLGHPALLDGATQERISELRVTHIPCNLKNPLSLVAAVRKLRPFLQNADLLHTHAMSTLIPLALRRISIPWVHTEHWSGYVEWKTGWRNVVRHAMATLAHRPQVVVSVSSVLAQTIAELSQRTVRVIPNIVEFGELHNRPKIEPTRALRIVAVGNLISRKRPLLAAQACHILNERGIPTSLTWVGEGPLREELRSYCENNNVELHLPGLLDSNQVGKEYANADISIFPTAAETFGLVGAEALAAGRPLVAGSNGGQRDFVAPPTGMLVDGENPADYADAVITVLKRTEGMTAADIAAPIRERFSFQQLVEGYQEIYRDLLR